MTRVGSDNISIPTESFLLEVQKRPCLWDPSDSNFHNRNIKRTAFCSIADELIPGTTDTKNGEIGNCLSKKWEGIREHYFKVMYDLSRSHNYSSNRYIQLLGFLDKTLDPQFAKTAKNSGISSQYNSENARYSPPNKSVCPANNVSPPSHHSSSNDPSRAPMNSDRYPGSQSTQGTSTRAPKRKRSTVMIDGVEFEQVTLSNGEVIVKLKEEVLESCSPPKGGATDKPKLVVPVTDDLKIACASSLAFMTPESELKIISTSTLGSNEVQSRAESIFLNGVPTQKNISTRVPNFTSAIRSIRENPQVECRSVSAVQELTTKKFGIMLKSENSLTVNQTETGESEVDSEKDTSLDVGEGKNRSNKQVSTSFVNCRDEGLKRKAALPKTFNQPVKDSSQQPRSTHPASNDSCSNDGQSLRPMKRIRTNRNTDVLKMCSVMTTQAGPQGSSPNLRSMEGGSDSDLEDGAKIYCPPKVLKTNLNKALTYPSPESRLFQPVELLCTLGETLKANRNAVLRNSGPKDQNPPLHPGLLRTPEKTLNTNLNSRITTNDSNDNSFGDEQDFFTVSARITPSAGRLDEEHKLSSPSSNPIVISDEEGELVSKNTPDSPEEDADQAFLLSLLPEMKTMTDTQNFEFRLEIMQALTRIRYSETSE